MPVLFDPGYGNPPFRALVENFPGESEYPATRFRTQWGPVFHRGRLDGSAKLLVVGQDPAQHENVVRRILVGEAGHRVQGFLAKLGITDSYVMVNTFLYSLVGSGGSSMWNTPDIAGYRNSWLDAVFDTNTIEAVVALGTRADQAWNLWKNTPAGASVNVHYAKITHPTWPESSGGGAAAIATLLANWNTGLNTLQGSIQSPDVSVPLTLYGTKFLPEELPDIPRRDLPAGSPAWMISRINWAFRGPAAPEPALPGTRENIITLRVPGSQP
jgi:uracil-DNA glycosylase